MIADILSITEYFIAGIKVLTRKEEVVFFPDEDVCCNGCNDQQDLIVQLLETIVGKENQLGVNLERIRADVATIQENEAQEAEDIAAIAELIRNSTPDTDLGALADQLDAVVTASTANSDALDSLNPDVPGGSVDPTTPDEEPVE